MENAKESRLHLVPKGWGYEKWICNNEKYCGKIKLIYGTDDLIEYANEVVLQRGSHFHVSIGLRHQMIALEDTELFEFSTQHFDEDSYRIIKGD